MPNDKHFVHSGIDTYTLTLPQADHVFDVRINGSFVQPQPDQILSPSMVTNTSLPYHSRVHAAQNIYFYESPAERKPFVDWLADNFNDLYQEMKQQLVNESRLKNG